MKELTITATPLLLFLLTLLEIPMFWGKKNGK